MTPYAIANLFAFGANVFLGVFVLAQPRHRGANRQFALCCSALAVLALATFSLVQPLPRVDALRWSRVLLIAASVVPALLLHTTLGLFGIERRILVPTMYVASAAAAALASIGMLDGGVRSLPLGPDGAGWYFVAVPSTLLLALLSLIAVVVIGFELIGFMRRATGIRRAQARYFGLAMVPLFVTGVHDMGGAILVSSPLTGSPVVPLMPVASAAWAAGVAFLMRRYRLMDLEAALTTGLIRTFTFVATVAPFVLLVAAAERAYMGGHVYGPFLLATVLLCALAASMVRPIQHEANQRLDRLFSVHGRDYRDALLSFTRESTRIMELETLLERVVETLASTLGVRMAVVYVSRQEAGFSLGAVSGAGMSKLPNQLAREHPLVVGLCDFDEPVVREELELGASGDVERVAELVRAMSDAGVDLALPLRSPAQVEGFILLGRRENGAIFAAEDIDVLRLLAGQVSIAVENARLYSDLRRSRELIQRSDRLSAIGTMAAGLAHEIRNPLVSIRTFTQLLPERLEDEEFRNKFMDLTLSEVDRICLLINELLAFARPAPAELQRVDLDDCLERICLLLESQARGAGVTLECVATHSLPAITADEDQVKQVVMNVILNAIQACEGGGRVRVSTSSHGEGDMRRVCIEIADDGPGIEDERLEHIFDPFYTTRREGTGLGLSIAHQIVSRHGGSIDVNTTIGVGTAFVISLPPTPALRVDAPQHSIHAVEAAAHG